MVIGGGCKGKLYLSTGKLLQYILYLRGMPVPGHTIGLEILIDLVIKEVFLQTLSCPTDPGLGINYDIIQIDDSLFHHRYQSQQ